MNGPGITAEDTEGEEEGGDSQLHHLDCQELSTGHSQTEWVFKSLLASELHWLRSLFSAYLYITEPGLHFATFPPQQKGQNPRKH